MEQEIGGYKELDLRKGFEYYSGNNVCRLNSGRAGIYYAIKKYNCKKALIPFYECSTVREFLARKGVEISYYHIDKYFSPIIDKSISSDTALVIVNYFGLIPNDRIESFKSFSPNLVVDNTQAFFSLPIEDAYSVYSPRKFFGVPDGAYVIGNDASMGAEEYLEDISSSTSTFLLRRIETGANNNYQYYLENERRIDQSDIKRMSKLTRALLDSIDYEGHLVKRRENFKMAKIVFSSLNEMESPLIENSGDNDAPIAYPLVIENDKVRGLLKEKHIYVGQWWRYLVGEMNMSSIESYYSRFLLPMPVDHRYGQNELFYMFEILKNGLKPVS
jgi:hypothetical protein